MTISTKRTAIGESTFDTPLRFENLPAATPQLSRALTKWHWDQDTASDLADAFGSFDRARLIRMIETDRASQLDARQLLYDYINALWADIERAGERPAVGEKYQAIAAMLELITALQTTAFEVVYNTPQ
jgi:hypothetical protein